MDHPVPVPQFLHDGDFLSVLKAHGYEVAPRLTEATAKFQHDLSKGGVATEGTTVLAVKFREGVVVAGDRRATAGNLVMYERAEKLINIDERSILAIAGVPAVAFEIARVLEHSFKYFQRSQLQEMSTAGKVRSLSKLLKENLPLTLQGIGMVVPIFATYEHTDDKNAGGKVYFYDALGAQFEGVDYAASGSGSLAVRSVLHYLNTWGDKPLAKYTESEIVVTALRLLDTAADSDTATSGYNPKSDIFPLVRVITGDGIREIPESELSRVYRSEV
jgi:proteasome beta subunit